MGVSTIVIEFNPSVDIDKKIQELREQVDIAKSELPSDASDPSVAKAQANDIPVINFSLTGNKTLTELTAIAEDIQTDLEQIPGVSKANIIGAQKEEVHIVVNENKAKEYNLTLSQISQIINSNNYNFPIGVITSDKINYSVRIDNRFTDIKTLQNLPLTTINNAPILLSDIATISKIQLDRPVTSRISINGLPPTESISLQVYKKEGGDIIAVADNAKLKVTELKQQLPTDIEIITTSDNSDYIRKDLGVLVGSGIQTTFLIVIILFLAIGFRQGLLVGLSIPLTLLITIFLLDLQGLTINSLTLFSMVIALGLMVDTAIVVMEGIHENLKEGQSPKTAAINSIQTFKWPLISGTLTTVFAFFPMLLVSGIVGEFLKSLPLTISAALFSSTFLSLTIIPAISTRFLKSKNNKPEKDSILEPIFKYLSKKIEIFMTYLLGHRTPKIITVLIITLLFILSLSLPVVGLLKVEMFPKTDVRYFTINIETPSGLILSETEKIVSEIEKILINENQIALRNNETPYIESFLTIIGSNQGETLTELVNFGGSQDSNLANINVNLVPADQRQLRSFELSANMREKLKNFPQAKITISELSEGPPSDAPISLSIVGDNIDTLRKISGEVQALIAGIPETENIRDTTKTGLNEFTFQLDPDRLTQFGLSSIQVSAQIRNIIQGIQDGTVKIDDEDFDLRIKYDIEQPKQITRLTIDQIRNFEIPTPFGTSVTLGQLGTYTLAESIATISREDQERLIRVRSDLGPMGNAIQAASEIEQKLQTYNLPSGYRIEFGGDNEAVAESFRDLFRSMIIGIMLIAATLVLIFNSLKQPFIILLAIPLALIGVFPGLMLIGLNLSFPAFLGIVALSGVVINDSIIIIDRINTVKAQGLSTKAALIESSAARLQPIMITSITTIVGILPLALTDEFWAGLGFSLIFGLTISTLLIVIVIPLLYYFFDRKNIKREEAQQN
jgi:HAE1 family hydrophobic/amphiphilic exporter-1